MCRHTISYMLLAIFMASAAFAQDNPYDQIPSEIRGLPAFLGWLDKEFDYCMKIPDERQPVEETIRTRSGDCEDLAKVTHLFLQREGLAESHIIFIKFRELDIQHAICAWKTPSGSFSYTSNKEYYETDTRTIEELLDIYFTDWERITYTDQQGNGLRVTANRK